MAAVRSIRALARGLEALHVLNQYRGATVTEVGQAIGLPRSTTYRILETLCQTGHVCRAPSDDKYRLTPLVRRLSGGLDEATWVTQIALPKMHALGEELQWPIAILTLSGTTMLVCQATDERSPLAIEKVSPGFRVPVLASAAGVAHLAFCMEQQREATLDLLVRSDILQEASCRRTRLLLEQTRQQGYAVRRRPRRVSDELSFAVPVRARDRVPATLLIRCSAAAVPEPEGIQRFVPRLQALAAETAEEFLEQRDADLLAGFPASPHCPEP